MNTALVTAAVCVVGPALLAACLLAWQRHPVIDAPDQPQIVDAEDHDDTPSPGEQAIIDQLRATRLRLEITPEMRARAARRFEEEFNGERLAEAALRPGRVRQVDARSVVDARTAFPAELDTPPYHDFERPSPITADELDEQVAAYEAAAAERFRRAGVTWPTNPATVGIARYDLNGGR